ncbi:hypothetical protein OLK001_13120 [Synechocystis sp. LKSZ1]
MNKIETTNVNPILNIGSSTKKFREEKNLIYRNSFFHPLENNGYKFIHSDLKQGEGVDIYGDIFSESVQQIISPKNPRSILLTNVLEHIADRKTLAETCLKLISSCGYLFISVPLSYPYHADPIDTYYRPIPSEIAQLFPNTTIVNSKIIEAGSLVTDTKSKKALVFFLKYVLRLFCHLTSQRYG